MKFRFHLTILFIFMTSIALAGLVARGQNPAVLFFATATSGAFSTVIGSDTFNSVNNTDLSTAAVDLGGSIIRRAGAVHAVNCDGSRHVYANGGGAAIYYVWFATPTGTSYQVDWYHKMTTMANTSLYVGVRMSTSVNTEYMATIDNTTAKILRSVNGIEDGTVIASSANASWNFTSTPAHCQLDATGTNPVQLNFTINGVVVCSTADSNANRIQTKGYPGFIHYFTDSFTTTWIATATVKE